MGSISSVKLVIVMVGGWAVGCGLGPVSEPQSSLGPSQTTSTYNAVPPLPAEPCAIDLDADRHPDSDVSQVTGRIVVDLGEVPQAGEFVGDPGDPGEFDVLIEQVEVPIQAGTLTEAGMVIELTAGVIEGTFYLPAEDGGSAIAEGLFPVVLVLPGFTAGHALYKKFSKHLASHGFAVLGLDTRSSALTAEHDKEAFEVVQSLDWLESAENPYRDGMDFTKIAVAGHSKGGKLGFFASALDARIDLVIGWDPSNGGGPPCFIPLPLGCNNFPVAPNCEVDDSGIQHYMHAETLVLGMPRDFLFNPDRQHNSIHFYRGAPAPASLVFIRAGHAGPLFNRAVIRLIKQVQVSVLLNRFYGMTGLQQYLPMDSAGELNLEQHRKVIRVESK